MSEAEMFDFGGALERMRAGKAVRRRGWDEGDHLKLFEPGIMAWRGKTGGFMWLPLQSDLLATDWETVKPQG